MKKIPDIRGKLKILEKTSQKLHDQVLEALKEGIGKKDVAYQSLLSSGFIYSIGCGRYYASFYSHTLLFMDGSIDLYAMSFDRISHLVASWKSIEKFKTEIANHFK